MTVEQAVLRLRGDPAWAQLMRDAYLDEDVAAAALRFERSGEFAEVRRWLGTAIQGAAVLDVGAGTGVASFAFARSGARQVVALEPDASAIVGQGAIRKVCSGLAVVQIASGVGEALPFSDDVFDVAYARQVLHHAGDLPRLVRECARVLRPGGVFVACREHVVDDARQLERFLRSHPIHQLAGGEHAWRVEEYSSAITAAGLEIRSKLGPWDSVVNAFPAVKDERERADYLRKSVEARLGVLGRIALNVPGVESILWRWVDRPVPGRLYSFVGVKRERR